MNPYVHEKTCTMFIAALFIIPQKWNNPNIHLSTDEQITCHIHKIEISHKKKQKYTTRVNLENMMLNERIYKKLYIVWFHLYKMPRAEAKETGSRSVIARACREVGRRISANEYGVSFQSDEMS